MTKLKNLRRYIEPLNRWLNNLEANRSSLENSRDSQSMERMKVQMKQLKDMKSLRDILVGVTKVSLAILDKCEQVLKNYFDNKPTTPLDPTTPRDKKEGGEHMCQALLDVVSGIVSIFDILP